MGTDPEAALEYPYKWPETSFLTDGKEITPVLGGDHEQFVTEANAYLKSRGLPPLDERIPVIAYGSNPSPYQLHKKMSANGQGEKPEVQVVPNEKAWLADAIIVWRGRPAQNGSTFAELYRGEGTKGKKAEVFVQYLTEE